MAEQIFDSTDEKYLAWMKLHLEQPPETPDTVTHLQ